MVQGCQLECRMDLIVVMNGREDRTDLLSPVGDVLQLVLQPIKGRLLGPSGHGIVLPCHASQLKKRWLHEQAPTEIRFGRDQSPPLTSAPVATVITDGV